jgi:hypothetical protein
MPVLTGVDVAVALRHGHPHTRRKTEFVTAVVTTASLQLGTLFVSDQAARREVPHCIPARLTRA